MNALRRASIVLTALALVGCDARATLPGKYNVEQDGYGFGPGADKIVLDLRADKSFDVTAGPLEMLKGTWKVEKDELIFSQGQGSISTTYRIEGDKLLPVVEGEADAGWRWKRM